MGSYLYHFLVSYSEPESSAFGVHSLCGLRGDKKKTQNRPKILATSAENGDVNQKYGGKPIKTGK